MFTDKVSIIIPVYNCEKYLDRCLNSIITQNYSNLEILLIDDGSIDNSGKMCDEYAEKDKRIRVFHKHNGGQSSARNIGLDNATGDLIGFVDSDDWIEPGTLEYLANLIERNDADICNIRCRFVKTDLTESSSLKTTERVLFGKEALELLMYEAVVGIPASMGVYRGLYKRQLLSNIRFVEGRINEDMVFCYEVYSRASKSIFSTRVCYNYFMSPQSTTRGPLKKKELDLLWASSRLKELSCNESYGRINHYVKIKASRSYFSLLAKAAFYGVDETQINKKETINYLTTELRKNWGKLMKSPIHLNRKLLMTLFCCNFKSMEFLVRTYKLIRH